MQNTMDIYYLVDRSKSMQPRKEQVLRGLNEFLDSQKSMASRLSLYTFSDALETLWEHESVDHLHPLTEDEYQPAGCTALLDAMGILLEEKIQWDTREKVVLVVLTDGDDNISFRYTRYRIQQLVDQHRSQLELVFVGSNQEDILFDASESCLEYEDAHLDRAFHFTTNAIRRFQTQETPSVQFTPLEREQTMEWK